MFQAKELLCTRVERHEKLGVLGAQYKLMEEMEAGDEEMEDTTPMKEIDAQPVVRCFPCWSVHGIHQKYLGGYVV